MIIGKFENTTKWNYGISLTPCTYKNDPLEKEFKIWCFKLNKEWSRGEALPIGFLDKEQGKGFFYRKNLFTDWTITLYTKTFTIPYWISIKKDKHN